VADLKARLVVQGANIPVTAAAERALHDRGVLSVPDFVANAGGVICAAMEYRGATLAQAFSAIAEKLRSQTQEVLERAGRDKLPRETAVEMAEARIRGAMRYQRWAR
jgi:glutamate dehydrogenase (NAD(P)+)